MTNPEQRDQRDPRTTQGPQNRVQRTVSVEAIDPKAGMTLDEMAAFVQDAIRADIDGSTPVKVAVMTLDEMAGLIRDAMRADIGGSTPIKVTVGFRSQVRTVTIEEER